MPRNRDAQATDLARDARKQPSVAEGLMWEALRSGKLGFKFRREHPVDRYRLDFYCPEAHLAVELDGEQHDRSKDAERDAVLARSGILTFRIPNRQLFMLDEDPYRDELTEIQRLREERTGREAFPET